MKNKFDGCGNIDNIVDLEDGWLTKEEIANIKNRVKMEMLFDNTDYDKMRIMLINEHTAQQLNDLIKLFNHIK